MMKKSRRGSHRKPALHKDNKNRSKKNNSKKQTATGIISINSKGAGYVRVEDIAQDTEIQNENLGTALNKDEVLIEFVAPRYNRPQGKVVKILKRSKSVFVGNITLDDKDQKAIKADDPKIHLYIDLETEADAPLNNKVLFKITDWEGKNKRPVAKIIKIIGAKGEHNTEMESIVLDKGFEISFPREVEDEAEKIKKDSEHKEYWEKEALKRRDFRKITTFTIDPWNAKDFDDAISIKKIANDVYEIGVHIADVSHYVTDGSALDKEARKRGTSVYLVDRTIPMLPETLSNDLCSLNPEQDRLAFSAVFDIKLEKNKALITKRWFGKTIINSDKRFTYESAQKNISSQSGEFAEELLILDKIAKVLREEKFKKGAIDFESDEVYFELDEKGKPLAIHKKERLDTHKLVEEFMLLANREVAEHFFKSQEKQKFPLSFIYRIHEDPNPDKLAELAIFVRALGYDFDFKDKVTSKDIAALLKKVEGGAQESLIKTAAIRSMAKAIYSTANAGHFGLAFEYYTHFTSPIRRYPDLLVHRVLFHYLSGDKISTKEFGAYQKMASEASENEIRAAEAERNSIKLKQVEYMSDKIGQDFDGIISGVTEWGLYVEEVNTKAEGMVRLRDMKSDYYSLDKKNYALVGEKTGKKYSLGDKVRFKITKADMERRSLDCVLSD